MYGPTEGEIWFIVVFIIVLGALLGIAGWEVAQWVLAHLSIAWRS